MVAIPVEISADGLSTSYAQHAGPEHRVITIPWCNRKLQWQVLLGCGPGAAPDFIFDDETFAPLLGDMTAAQAQQLRSLLGSWDPGRAGGLYQIVTLLVGGYQSFQHARLLAVPHTRLQFELSTLTLSPQLELLLLPGRTHGDADKALFGIPLVDLDRTPLAAALAVLAIGPVPAAAALAFKLHVTFSLTTAIGPPDLLLEVPPLVSALLPALNLPPWTSHMCLMEYVPLLIPHLRHQLDSQCADVMARHQLLHHLGEVLGRPADLSVAEGVAWFQLQWDSQLVLLLVDLPVRFPEEKPKLQLQTMRFPAGQDVTRLITEYPWSPRWTAQEMATRIYNFLRDELPAFLRSG